MAIQHKRNHHDAMHVKAEPAVPTKPQTWESKQISLSDVPTIIPNGSKVYIGSTTSTAEQTLTAMTKDWKLADIQIIQMIPGGSLPHLQEGVDRFRTSGFYSFTRTGYFTPGEQGTKDEGLDDYTPVSITEVPRLLDEHKLQVDVAVIKVTRPHKGYVSLGVGVEATRDFIRHSKIVIAEVNENMPWTEGQSKIEMSRIDYWIDSHTPMRTTEQLWPALFEYPTLPMETQNKIGKNVLKLISDGATLRFGLTPIVRSVVPFLHERTNLGLHTDVLTEDLYKLHEDGVITNALKTIDKGRSVVTQAHGSQDLYEFCDRNPMIEFHPTSYVCDPQTLAKIDNLVSVVGALKVDVTGQVAIDSVAHKFFGGVWSDDDSIRGARFSKGGKPIVVVPAKSISGRSNIVFDLPPGTGVAITRSDVEYVVTEYGTAYLYGKSVRERCLALIDIAHPDFRQDLLAQAKEKRYISQSQPGLFSSNLYPSELECVHKTKSGKSVLVRPIKATDEDILRNFFHKLSDHSVYLRYFRKMKSMPQRILQKTTDVDYSKDMAIVVLSPPDSYPQELVAIGQWVSDPHGGAPEVAFQVRDDWQGEGLGTYLYRRLVCIAQSIGLKSLKADVLSDNTGMNAVFQRSQTPFTKRTDFGVVSYSFDLSAVSGDENLSPNTRVR